MKSFGLFVCLLLCVLPSQITAKDQKVMFAKAVGVKVEDVVECLNKINTDFETLMELGDTVSIEDEGTHTQEVISKIGCFGACIFKKNGLLVNSKIIPEKVEEASTRMGRRDPNVLEYLRPAIQRCTNRVSKLTNDCDITFMFSQCVVKEMQSSRSQ
ncbi:hypothetical protein KPH14_006839 [Odynerus spinipes]|uniref:Uncharacterized protein n=1 Tax=Odynerus spinipes TaxID=1348599 RepID=A0AAD9VRU5_9HYME|nr:hypothetical protein KPH14_006839 [Odynerus spinipes]